MPGSVCCHDLPSLDHVARSGCDQAGGQWLAGVFSVGERRGGAGDFERELFARGETIDAQIPPARPAASWIAGWTDANGVARPGRWRELAPNRLRNRWRTVISPRAEGSECQRRDQNSREQTCSRDPPVRRQRENPRDQVWSRLIGT